MYLYQFSSLYFLISIFNIDLRSQDGCKYTHAKTLLQSCTSFNETHLQETKNQCLLTDMDNSSLVNPKEVALSLCGKHHTNSIKVGEVPEREAVASIVSEKSNARNRTHIERLDVMCDTSAKHEERYLSTNGKNLRHMQMLALMMIVFVATMLSTWNTYLLYRAKFSKNKYPKDIREIVFDLLSEIEMCVEVGSTILKSNKDTKQIKTHENQLSIVKVAEEHLSSYAQKERISQEQLSIPADQEANMESSIGLGGDIIVRRGPMELDCLNHWTSLNKTNSHFQGLGNNAVCELSQASNGIQFTKKIDEYKSETLPVSLDVDVPQTDLQENNCSRQDIQAITLAPSNVLTKETNSFHSCDKSSDETLQSTKYEPQFALTVLQPAPKLRDVGELRQYYSDTTLVLEEFVDLWDNDCYPSCSKSFYDDPSFTCQTRKLNAGFPIKSVSIGNLPLHLDNAVLPLVYQRQEAERIAATDTSNDSRIVATLKNGSMNVCLSLKPTDRVPSQLNTASILRSIKDVLYLNEIRPIYHRATLHWDYMNDRELSYILCTTRLLRPPTDIDAYVEFCMDKNSSMNDIMLMNEERYRREKEFDSLFQELLDLGKSLEKARKFNEFKIATLKKARAYNVLQATQPLISVTHRGEMASVILGLNSQETGDENILMSLDSSCFRVAAEGDEVAEGEVSSQENCFFQGSYKSLAQCSVSETIVGNCQAECSSQLDNKKLSMKKRCQRCLRHIKALICCKRPSTGDEVVNCEDKELLLADNLNPNDSEVTRISSDSETQSYNEIHSNSDFQLQPYSIGLTHCTDLVPYQHTNGNTSNSVNVNTDKSLTTVKNIIRSGEALMGTYPMENSNKDKSDSSMETIQVLPAPSPLPPPLRIVHKNDQCYIDGTRFMNFDKRSFSANDEETPNDRAADSNGIVLPCHDRTCEARVISNGQDAHCSPPAGQSDETCSCTSSYDSLSANSYSFTESETSDDDLWDDTSVETLVVSVDLPIGSNHNHHAASATDRKMHCKPNRPYVINEPGNGDGVRTRFLVSADGTIYMKRKSLEAKDDHLSQVTSAVEESCSASDKETSHDRAADSNGIVLPCHDRTCEARVISNGQDAHCSPPAGQSDETCSCTSSYDSLSANSYSFTESETSDDDLWDDTSVETLVVSVDLPIGSNHDQSAGTATDRKMHCKPNRPYVINEPGNGDGVRTRFLVSADGTIYMKRKSLEAKDDHLSQVASAVEEKMENAKDTSTKKNQQTDISLHYRTNAEGCFMPRFAESNFKTRELSEPFSSTSAPDNSSFASLLTGTSECDDVCYVHGESRMESLSLKKKHRKRTMMKKIRNVFCCFKVGANKVHLKEETKEKMSIPLVGSPKHVIESRRSSLLEEAHSIRTWHSRRFTDTSDTTRRSVGADSYVAEHFAPRNQMVETKRMPQPELLYPGQPRTVTGHGGRLIKGANAWEPLHESWKPMTKNGYDNASTSESEENFSSTSTYHHHESLSDLFKEPEPPDHSWLRDYTSMTTLSFEEFLASGQQQQERQYSVPTLTKWSTDEDGTRILIAPDGEMYMKRKDLERG